MSFPLEKLGSWSSADVTDILDTLLQMCASQKEALVANVDG